jgi:hypothetical protein
MVEDDDEDPRSGRRRGARELAEDPAGEGAFGST